MRLLVAGIGNIFFGDDAFGVEVVRELSLRVLPPEIEVVDFGIRAHDLAFALTIPYDAIILVDATPRGEAPGTVCLLELDSAQGGGEETPIDAHSLAPVQVLQMAKAFGGITAAVYLVGCEPKVLEPAGEELGLSDVVRSAIPSAISMLESLIKRLLQRSETGEPRIAPVAKGTP